MSSARYGGNTVVADAGRCRTCGAPIIWARSARTGRPMPLDARPTTAGTFVIVQGSIAMYSPGTPGDRYRSHFASCPDADKHRKS